MATTVISDEIVPLHGALLSNVPDVNGSQIQVDRIEVKELASGGTIGARRRRRDG